MGIGSIAAKIGGKALLGGIGGPIGAVALAADVVPLLADFFSGSGEPDPAKMAQVAKVRDNMAQQFMVSQNISQEKALALANEQMKPLLDDAAKPEGGIPEGKTALDAGALGLTAALAMRGGGAGNAARKAAIAGRQKSMAGRSATPRGAMGDMPGDPSAMGAEVEAAAGEPAVRGLTPTDQAEGANAAMMGGARSPAKAAVAEAETMPRRTGLTPTDVDEGKNAALQGGDMAKLEQLKQLLIQNNLGRRTPAEAVAG